MRYNDLTAEEKVSLCEEAILDLLMGRHYPSIIQNIGHISEIRAKEIARLFWDIREVNLETNLNDTQPNPWGDYDA